MRVVVQIVLAVLVLTAGGLGAWALIEYPPIPETSTAAPPLPSVRVQTVRLEDAPLRVASQGTVLPSDPIGLVPEVSGAVAFVAPQLVAGGFFAKGDVLLRIDPRDYELAVTRTRAQVAQAETALAIEQAQAMAARAEWQALGLEGAPSPLVLRTPQVEQARAALAAAQAAQARTELDLERTTWRAPFAGRVRSEQISVGQFVLPGVAVAQLYSTAYAEVRLPLADEELAFLDLDLAARGVLDGPPVLLSAAFAGRRRQWDARVVRLEGEVDAGTGMVHLVARVDDPYGQADAQPRAPLTAGMFVQAEIRGRTLRGVVVLPREALRDDGHVLVLDAEDRVHDRQVKLARAERTSVLVRDGLLPGERVCVTPLAIATEGMRVAVLAADVAGPVR